MSMKSPEQITLDAILRNYNGREGLSESLAQGDVDADGVQAMIVAAIEADRAQRRELPPALSDDIGADFQNGEALIFTPAFEFDGWTDAVAYDEGDDQRIVRYSYEHATDTVTAYHYRAIQKGL